MSMLENAEAKGYTQLQNTMTL